MKNRLVIALREQAWALNASGNSGVVPRPVPVRFHGQNVGQFRQISGANSVLLELKSARVLEAANEANCSII